MVARTERSVGATPTRDQGVVGVGNLDQQLPAGRERGAQPREQRDRIVDVLEHVRQRDQIEALACWEAVFDASLPDRHTQSSLGVASRTRAHLDPEWRPTRSLKQAE